MSCAYAVAHDPSARYAGTSPRKGVGRDDYLSSTFAAIR